ncbi:MAG: DUF4231 domain-containing protein [Methanothrix sp.]|nr:MAG: DUF4231 domain-containing protein [Methanothrix sp.]
MANSPSQFSWDDENLLPSLYVSANRAATKSQRAHVTSLALNYSFILLGAGFGALASFILELKSMMAIFSAISLFLGTTISATLKAFNLEKKWLEARSVAESVKTLVVRYITAGDMFNPTLPPKVADTNFLNRIKEILANRKELGKTIAKNLDIKPQITAAMRNVRTASLEERKKFYIEQRVNDQINWYSRKAGWNNHRSTLWMVSATVAQALAAIFAVMLASNHNWKFNVVPLFATLATILLSWNRVKRYDELSDSYAVSAQELCAALNAAEYVDTESELCRYVADVEQTISREHTMWVARRSSQP